MIRAQPSVSIFSSRGVVLRPLQAMCVLWLVTLAVAAAYALATTGRFDLPLALPLAALGVAMVIGGLQSVYWFLAFGRRVYVLDFEGVSVTQNGRRVSSWRWHDIDTVHIRGYYSWYHLATAFPASSFPHLEVRRAGSVERAKSVLLWGKDGPEADDQLQRMLRQSRRLDD